ncbi:De-etiolated protein 1 Det1-domain-containing protein [Phlyctochytrium arcticum]|nr:De-etiolated protein 1 Det1-domain-containing protein [Phlyctochytrium arcticum]
MDCHSLRKRKLTGEGGIVGLIREREVCPLSRNLVSRTHRFIYPMQTTYDLTGADTVIKRFSPDGKYLVCFSNNLHAVKVLNFQPNLEYAADDSDKSFSARDLTLRFETNLTSGHELLCKDFLLFTQDFQQVIVASAVVSPEDDRIEFDHRSLDEIVRADNVTFWSINITTGEITDSRLFENEHIFLSHHAGVHLYGDLFGIASVKKQQMYILQVQKSGMFLELRRLGWLNHEDDQLELSRYEVANCIFSAQNSKALCVADDIGITSMDDLLSDEELASDSGKHTGNGGGQGAHSSTVNRQDPPDRLNAVVPDVFDMSTVGSAHTMILHPTAQAITSNSNCNIVDGLKQRIMQFLFRKAYVSGERRCLQDFYRMFPDIVSLASWRMSFIDRFHILIKFGTVATVLGKRLAAQSQTEPNALFVIYSLLTTSVIGIFDTGSEEFLEYHEKFQVGMGTLYNLHGRAYPNVSNSIFARCAFRRSMCSVAKAKNGGRLQAVSRILAALPRNEQTVIDSPYLNCDLYKFNDKYLSDSDRACRVGDMPIKFFDRESGRLKFRIDPHSKVSRQRQEPGVHNKRYVRYIFHPYEPFVISIQTMIGSDNIINIHHR